jgi:hypothetical protein
LVMTANIRAMSVITRCDRRLTGEADSKSKSDQMHQDFNCSPDNPADLSSRGCALISPALNRVAISVRAVSGGGRKLRVAVQFLTPLRQYRGEKSIANHGVKTYTVGVRRANVMTKVQATSLAYLVRIMLFAAPQSRREPAIVKLNLSQSRSFRLKVKSSD